MAKTPWNNGGFIKSYARGIKSFDGMVGVKRQRQLVSGNCCLYQVWQLYASGVAAQYDVKFALMFLEGNIFWLSVV